MDQNKRIEKLGPAEHLIQTILTHSDHAYHGRPGIVTAAPTLPTGVKWEAASCKNEGPEGGPKQKIAYYNRKAGTKTVKVRAGVLGDDKKVRENGRIVGEYRQPGLFPEVVAWAYRSIAEVWKLDNEFAARWASWAFGEEHRDMKAILAAFMLVQNRCGEPVRENGEVLFLDEDYRMVGVAMCLLRRTDKRDLRTKDLLRIRDILMLPEIAAINRDLGFGRSAKNPTLGRWPKAIERYLAFHDHNPKYLKNLVEKGAYRTSVMALSRAVGYKPVNPRFFQILRWKQVQSKAGHRVLAIGAEVKAAESWEGLSEADICQRILATKPSYKRIGSLIPSEVGFTRAIVAASVEAGVLSDADMFILTPTLEEFGLLDDPLIKARLELAATRSDNQRAGNIAANVKHQATKELLQKAADTAVAKAVEEVVKGLAVYVMVDVSGSMEPAIEKAKDYVARLLGGFPLEKLHVATFNTSGTVRAIKHESKAGVEAAFRGVTAGGGTDYGSGVLALQHLKPPAGDDALFIFIGDEQHTGGTFERAVMQSGLSPVAFGLLKVAGADHDRGVRETAVRLGIPCFPIDEGIFNDAYSVPRALRNLIAVTPVAKNVQPGRPVAAVPRLTLVEKILKTDLLTLHKRAKAA